MNVVIVGDGKVGAALAEQLSREGHDITIIDNRANAIRHSVETLDIKGVMGNGAILSVQKEAGVDKADLLIAATSTDEMNMICCLMAKKIGAKRTIARIRDPEYSSQLVFLQEELGLSMTINPESATAGEIAQLLSFPAAVTMGNFAGGKADMIEVKLEKGSLFAGKKLADLERNSNFNVLVCLVERGGEVFIPNGKSLLMEGDRIFITGTNAEIGSFLKANGKASAQVKNVMIIGGGRISIYLTKILAARGLQVKIIEKNLDRCVMLSELLPEAMIIQGDGTEQDLLVSEDIRSADALVALTDIDEENLIIAMYAINNGVPKVIPKINRLHYADIIEKMGIDSCVSPKQITANNIVRYVRAMEKTKDSSIKTLYRVAGDRAEILEFDSDESTRHIGEAFKDVRFKENVIVAGIVRNGRLMIPRGRDSIQRGDAVIIMAKDNRLMGLNDIFED